MAPDFWPETALLGYCLTDSQKKAKITPLPAFHTHLFDSHDTMPLDKPF